MASNAAGTIITLGAVAGIGYYLYSSGMLSSLMGSSSPANSATPTTGGGVPAGGTNPVPVRQACDANGILPVLLKKVQALPTGKSYGPNLPGTFTIDEWGYYLNELCSGMADQYGVNAGTLFPTAEDRGGPLNWSAFEGWAKQKGLSAIPRRRRGRRPMIGTKVVRRVA